MTGTDRTASGNLNKDVLSNLRLEFKRRLFWSILSSMAVDKTRSASDAQFRLGKITLTQPLYARLQTSLALTQS